MDSLTVGKVFGFTIESLRLLSVTVVTVGIISLWVGRVRLLAGLLGACYAALAMSFHHGFGLLAALLLNHYCWFL